MKRCSILQILSFFLFFANPIQVVYKAKNVLLLPATSSDAAVYRHGIIGDSCSHSSPAAYSGCKICLVEVEGRGVVPPSSTFIEKNMVIHTDTTKVKEARIDNLSLILFTHPHA